MLYNGYAPNETKRMVHRPRKADKGHTMVEMLTMRPNNDFSLRYAAICQCGKVFTSKRSRERTFWAHSAHQRKVQS